MGLLTNTSNTGPAAGTFALDDDVVLLGGAGHEPQAGQTVVVGNGLHDHVALVLAYEF